MTRSLSWSRLVTPRRAFSASLVVALLGAAVVWVNWDSGESYRTEDREITVRSGPERNEPVSLDTTLYVPESASRENPAPAVLLAHGFGGTKRSVTESAGELASRGYVVLTWSARGFGNSGGTISLNAPDYEVNDARGLIDVLALRPEVRKDGSDPKVGVVGGSYGGALAMLLAANDRRVDAIVPQITWHNLADAFFPESTGGGATAGVFKRNWAGLFFGSGSGLDPAALLGQDDRPALRRDDVQCGRFSPEVCQAYLQVATAGRATDEAIALLESRSPKSVLGRIKAPTLLVQGQADTLFPLSEADANARGIAAAGTPVRVAWFSGGHDGEGSDRDVDRVKFLTLQWLDHYVAGKGEAPATSFTYSTPGGISVRSSRATTLTHSTERYPGLDGDVATKLLSLRGGPQQVANPPSGTPAAISSLPGIGQLAAVAGGASLDVPGQFATFQSEPLDKALDVVGSPGINIRAASPTGEAVLFAKLYDVAPGQRPSLVRGLAAPIRLTNLPSNLAEAQPVGVTLPAIAHRFEAGHTARLVLATSDQAYATPAEPGVYQVAVDGELSLPAVDASPVAGTEMLWRWVLAALIALVAVGVLTAVLVTRARHRRIDNAVEEDIADTPLVVRGLRKAYGDGFLAVRELSFRVERGQVVGLLGPNGAGKTTALRMLMGLIQPTAGEILVFGHRVTSGAPVLSRLGAFVEGSGFLPHLSGADNLRRYWQATGRPAADAHVEQALEIAGLGTAIDRKVKAYSQGMRQRLAIAQAMLGLPDLLVLDEPTNGLDPPQIREMREVLRRYATGGRAVLVSSHLLAEVEQVCSHVVVMHKGELVADGPVEEIVGESTSVLVDVTDRDAAMTALKALDGVAAVSPNGHGIVVDLDGAASSEVVKALVSAGVGVDRIAPRRKLEDVFLALVGEDKAALVGEDQAALVDNDAALVGEGK